MPRSLQGRAQIALTRIASARSTAAAHDVTTWRQVVATADHQRDRVVVGRGGGASRQPHYRPTRRSRANKPEYLRSPNLVPPSARRYVNGCARTAPRRLTNRVGSKIRDYSKWVTSDNGRANCFQR
ncbi:unnamed protein product [Chrysodeixis includens]|uniref:Uncharacterized protein n=1 Tax=Chrysodeixis includens TaxID=689277 RepID=A0A9N8KSS5_CHRIL|nr:unnamed protein product [Chrysodeixis includens]